MSGNTFGKLFCVTSYGESHGKSIGCVIDGCPPGIKIDTDMIQKDLDRRKPGTSRHVTQRRETDQVEILSGVFEGISTGAPICLQIKNIDQKSKDYSNIANAFRPGHADFTYQKKYGLRDFRGGGRQSARETAVRVAAGAIAKKILHEEYGIKITGFMSQLGKIKIPFVSFKHINHNPFFSPNEDIIPVLENFMDSLRKSGDSCGAKLTVVVENVPTGLGQPVFDRLDADLAYAIMGINAVKGVEIGSGFASVEQLGSEHSDEIRSSGFVTNNSGGVLGGISTGQNIVLNLAIKPTSSIRLDRKSVNLNNENIVINTHGRHDPCVGIRATPITEAMVALVLLDHDLRFKAQCYNVPKEGFINTYLNSDNNNFDDKDPDEA